MNNLFNILTKFLKFILLTVTLAYLFSLKLNNEVFASIDSCTALVNPNSMTVSSTSLLYFSVTNNSSTNNVLWVKITKPSADFTVNGGSAGGWNSTSNDESVTFAGGSSIVALSSGTFPVNVTAGGGVITSSNWTVQVSDSVDGASPTTCTGNTGVAITEAPAAGDTTPPTITNLTISDVSQTSVKISWNTDEVATTVVQYGTTDELGSTNSNSSLSFTHSVTLENLSANTTYYYNVQSADAAGNITESGNNTFVSSKAATTSTTTVTTTTTVTKTISDAVLPSLKVNTDFTKTYQVAPEIIGSASDDKGVSRIDYSIDDGKNWLTAEMSGKVGDKSVSYSFAPNVYDDGNYKIRVRAIDTTGNIQISKRYELIIDRLPPQVGAVTFALGPLILKNNFLTGIEYDVFATAIGGAIELEMEFENGEETKLSKNEESGIWKGKIKFDTEGENKILISAIDGGGTEVTKELTVIMIGPGKTKIDSEIKVFYFDQVLNEFSLWDGGAYNQENPIQTNENGEYGLFLPAGKYYLEIGGPSYKTLRSQIFEIDSPTPINANFDLEEIKSVQIGRFKLRIPYIIKSVPIVFGEETGVRNEETGEQIGQEFPDLGETNFRGKNSIIYLTNSFLPEISDQIQILDRFSEDKRINIATILIHESDAKAEIVKRKGEYKIPISGDADGILVEPLQINHLPLILFLDKRGIVTSVLDDHLVEEEIVKFILGS